MPRPVFYHEGGFPPANIDWNVLIPLLGPAAAAVARYDGTLSRFQTPQFYSVP